MSKVEVDRNLLFGLLALQTGLIDQGVLFTAFNVWTRNKTQSMAAILVSQGDLDAARRSLLEALVAEHLKMHGDDPHKSLAAIEAGPSTRERLAELNDADLAASVALIGPNLLGVSREHSRPIPAAADSSRSDRMVHLLTEQQRRWEQGEQIFVEDILKANPDLSTDPERVLDLIYNEIILRERRGESPSSNEYAGRFPELSDAIRRQFEIHRVFAEDGPEPSAGTAERTATFSVGTSSSSGLRFRVLRPHARGGLGAVFVALDTELHREVALKQIVDRHADDPTSRRRFLVEAEIAGGLEHPGIVPVYGLGSYANGRPYYAMRFIRGDSLKDAIAAFHGEAALKRDSGRRSLELRKLLRRFVDVCNAIEYAHSRGVLHRDLKPGNIIVGKHGETLVVDWGLAKSVGRAETSVASEERTLVPSSASGSGETLPGSALGTPAYMSPEQAAGDLDRLGPRSDVYSLGATLYVLLTGRPPFDGIDLGALLEAVRFGEYLRPRKVDPSLEPSLEAICVRAMARAPEDRYASPRELADDIERWMADEPVTARRESLAERVRRAMRRHRTLMVSSAAVLFLGLIGVSAFAALVSDKNGRLIAANSATRQAELLADARLDRAMASIEDYFTGFSADALKGGQLPTVLRDRLLAKPRDFYEQLAAELRAKPNPSERERALLAKGQRNLGRILSILGKNSEAREQDKAAIASFEALVARHPDVADYQNGLLATWTSLGLVHADTGRADEAIDAYKKAIEVGEALAARHPEVDEYQNGLARSNNNLGLVLAAKGQADQAAGACKKSVMTYETLVAREPNKVEYQYGLASSNTNLGIVLGFAGRSDEAADAHRKAVEIYERLAARYPDVGDYQNGLATSQGNLAIVLSAKGRIDEAIGALRKAIRTYEALVGRQPDVPQFQGGLARSLGTLGILELDTGLLDVAVASLRKAMTVYRALAARYADVPEYQHGLGACSNNIGLALADAGQPEKAVSEFRESVAIFKALTVRHPDVPLYQNGLAMSQTYLGVVLAATGRTDLAVAAYKNAIAIGEALAVRQPNVPDFQDALANSHKKMGLLLKTQRRFADALDQLHGALKASRPGTPANAEISAAIRETERAMALSGRLPALLKAADRPKDASEGLVFAQLCYDQSRYAAAARIWDVALAADPKLADDRESAVRYKAACAAVLAAAGQGNDKPALDSDAAAKLRAQAQKWLTAELAVWTEVLETGPAQAKAVVLTLQKWLFDRDLASVRDRDALAKLPEAERKDWRELWERVTALLTKARTAHR
jgi:serine/threonine-protein kinase